MKIEIGKSYFLYGKLGYMKRFKPVAGGDFVSNLIHAEMVTPKGDDDVRKMEREVEFLSDQGSFEWREAK